MFRGKRGQITIFIILAILIVVAIVILFLFWGRISGDDVPIETPKSSVGKCIRDAVSPSVEKVLSGGGRVEPSFFIMYKDMKYNYLCYQEAYYLACVNHYPQLKKIIETEIEEDTVDDVRDCFDNLVEDYEGKGFVVDEGELDYSIDLMFGKVSIEVEKDINIEKAGSSQSFRNFDSSFISPVHDLAMIAREIVNQESQYCNFEYNGFMALYPEYDIKRIDYNNVKIYKLIDRKSGKEFKFAVRSCAFAPGY